MRHSLTALLIGLITMTGSTTNASPVWDNPSWQLQRDQNGIRVWTMREEGKTIDTYKSDITLLASIDQILPKLIDIEDFASWAPDIREAYALDSNNASYIAYAMPFPVKDRDMAQHYQIKTLEDRTVVLLSATPEATPKQKKRVRVQDAELVWTLIPSPDGNATTLQTIGFTDPEGEIPAFIINMLLVEGPYRTLDALRKSLAEGE